jgi:hypothetical protein
MGGSYEMPPTFSKLGTGVDDKRLNSRKGDAIIRKSSLTVLITSDDEKLTGISLQIGR